MEPSSVARLQPTDASRARLVSIVTVVFRACHDLPGLIDSVLQIKDEKTELIVIDGGSDDGTRELLQKYGSSIDYWVSERDEGIYDAMNKGVAAARGTFIFHLNAGDRLMSIPTRELEAARSTSVAAFRVLVDGKEEFRPSRGFALRVNNTLHHQGTFYRRDSFPGYDLRYPIFADFDLNQRLALSGAQIETYDQVVAIHASGGTSDVASRAAVSEFFSIIKKNYGPFYLPLAWVLCKWRGLISRIRNWG